MKIKIVLDEGAYMPERAHKTDAGFDLRTPKRALVHSNCGVFIDTGVHIEVPEGYCAMIESKSGLNRFHDIEVEGVVDAGYTGTIGCKIYNKGNKPYLFHKGDKIAQFVVIPIADVDELELVDKLEDSDRGDNGFGSTGR